jgi:hypothetical protein
MNLDCNCTMYIYLNLVSVLHIATPNLLTVWVGVAACGRRCEAGTWRCGDMIG